MKILQKHILHIIFKYFDLGDFQKYIYIYIYIYAGYVEDRNLPPGKTI